MPLLRALNTIPLWTLILGLLAVFELYSVGLMLLARRRLGFDRLKLNNEVAGFKFSVIGVLYAVLLAFVVIAVWENYNVTESAIRNEAKAAGDMAQLSYALPESQGEEMRRLLDAYVKEVQQSEWGTMAQGLPSKAAADALAHLTQATINMQVGQMRDLAVFQQALHLLAACRTCCSCFSASNPARLPVHWRRCALVSTIRGGIATDASTFGRAVPTTSFALVLVLS
jgi:hypothetical protein